MVRGINSAASSTFNSFALSLLTLNYFQHSLGRLPSFRALVSERSAHSFHFGFDESQVRPSSTEVIASEEELTSILCGFFEHWHSFDFENQIVSCTESQFKSKEDQCNSLDPLESSVVVIEDPLEKTNVARTLSQHSFQKISLEFERAANLMCKFERSGDIQLLNKLLQEKETHNSFKNSKFDRRRTSRAKRR